jgi:hypothetical protein
VRRYRGCRQGTDNERSLALGGSAGSRVAVESAPASRVREPDSCCSSRRRPRRTNPAAHRGRGSTSACLQEQQRRASRFSAGRHLCLVQGGRAGLDRRRARSRLNAGAAGCPFDAPSPGISAGGSCGTLHPLRRPDVRPVREKCGTGFPLRHPVRRKGCRSLAIPPA